MLGTNLQGRLKAAQTLPKAWRHMPDKWRFLNDCPPHMDDARVVKLAPHVHPLLYTHWLGVLRHCLEEQGGLAFLEALEGGTGLQPLQDAIHELGPGHFTEAWSRVCSGGRAAAAGLGQASGHARPG